MPEYFKPFFENKCHACEKYHCVNTKPYSADLKERWKERGVGRIRYDQGISIVEHKLPIQDCPTRKIIEKARKCTGSGLGWILVKGITTKIALGKLDEPAVNDPTPPGKLP